MAVFRAPALGRAPDFAQRSAAAAVAAAARTPTVVAAAASATNAGVGARVVGPGVGDVDGFGETVGLGVGGCPDS